VDFLRLPTTFRIKVHYQHLNPSKSFYNFKQEKARIFALIIPSNSQSNNFRRRIGGITTLPISTLGELAGIISLGTIIFVQTRTKQEINQS